MSNIKLEEAKRILKLAIIQENEIKIENLEVELKINKNKIEFSYKEESIKYNKEYYTLKFNYEDSIYNLKCKVNNKKGEIEVLKVISTENNDNRLIKVEDYGVLIINKKINININISNISNKFIFFKILKKDEDLVFDNLDKKLNMTMSYNEEDIEIEVTPKIESISKTEDTLIYSEIKIKEEKFKNIFNKYIKEKTNEQNKKEKSKLINNLIKEMY